ncbi:hypothetical protein ANN_12864 [Periplaneta americana]|uniref:Uncharacterized protein n=1 Tax=Periplaneta americana TaxID=6978 RepID=A0ABQ8THR6_PERAM|nr:hypothetical protein ANN_12864 [Periplaneta americana]
MTNKISRQLASRPHAEGDVDDHPTRMQRCPHMFILEETVLPSARISPPSACLPTHVKTDCNVIIAFRSIVRHPPPTRYAKAPRSFTSVHIALIMSETILTIDTDRTFVIMVVSSEKITFLQSKSTRLVAKARRSTACASPIFPFAQPSGS